MQKSDVLLEIRNIQASYKEYPALNNVRNDIKKNTLQYTIHYVKFLSISFDEISLIFTARCCG